MANRKLLDKLYKSLEEVPDDADVTAVVGLIAYKGKQDDQLPTVQAYGGRAHDIACVVADLIASLSSWLTTSSSMPRPFRPSPPTLTRFTDETTQVRGL